MRRGPRPPPRISFDFHRLHKLTAVDRLGIQVAIDSEQGRKGDVTMKLEIPLLAGLAFLATQLLARAQIQGFEGALLSSGVECGVRAWRAGSKRFRIALTHCAK